MEIQYVIKKTIRNSIKVHVGSDLKVYVEAPLGITTKAVEEFLLQKRNWILKQIEKIKNQQSLSQNIGKISKEDLKEIKKKAKKIIPQKVEFYAGKYGISYGKISIRVQKSRWGSCSAEGNLNFNCLLVLMPEQILESVVVHELCHRKYMNHSKLFYNEVLKMCPNYYEYDKWLKQNGPAYLFSLQD